MSDVANRLDRCFAAVFPNLPQAQTATASLDTVEGWDSVAAATLITTIEEEFGVEFDAETVETLTSYTAIESALQQLGC